MFTLKLDLIMTYVPPMSEGGRGLHLTRKLHFPFPPYQGLHICGRRIDPGLDPEGFVLSEVIWDVDRQVFLATVQMISHDLPIAEIPAELKQWMELGWRLGSYADKYKEPAPDDEEDEDLPTEDSSVIPRDEEWERQLQHPTLSPRKRPKALNVVMRAMVRAMAEQHIEPSVAYAMDRTKRHFSEEQLQDNDSKAAAQWQDAAWEYHQLGWRRQWAWRKHVLRHHPRLDKLVEQA